MALHRRAQIPLEGAGVVALHPEAEGVHHADQLLRLGVARARGRPQLLPRLLELAGFHQVARRLELRPHGRGQKPRGQHARRHSAHRLLPAVLALTLAAGAADATEPGRPAPAPARQPLPDPLGDADFLPVDRAKAEIGRLLFYDKILSGNRNISCGTCHHHDHAGSDGLSLGIGEGGRGVGPERGPGSGPSRIRKRIPRNAAALWNLGHRDIRVLLHDGRLEESGLYGNGFNSPAQEWLPEGLPDIVAAQALLPLAAQFEMAGNPAENEVAGAIHDRIDYGWPILAKRVRTIPAYGEAFVAAFDGIGAAEEVGIVEIATALSHFIRLEWRNHDSPFDRHLAGDRGALSPGQKAGMALFYGDAGCAECHSGPLLSDQRFHALGLPQFGPGRTRRWDPAVRDVGRMAESNRLEDAYRFRTPPLRNVALTAPYGHNGAWPTLEGIVRHHLDPEGARAAWRPEMARLPDAPWLSEIDFVVRQDRLEAARHARALDIRPRALEAAEIDQIVAFLHALTGETADDRPLGRPETVPSGLPVD
jgi:cytochrome c peroxidase